jgi:NAD(P)-dependent dehydrogenase (short-subunit alcohol dehydrogenase family)
MTGMAGLCDGRVCIVTGAGGGIGREHALLLAAHGARVVVNDLGASLEGDGTSEGPANAVVREILEAGGEAVANTDDVSSWEGAQRLVQQAVDTYGRLDVLVNNAGILRDRMLVNMTEDEWDAVIRVHLKGTFAPSRHAAAHWRERVKAGEEVDARLINTTSVSGIYGNVGQTNYGAAKMGVAGFTIIAAEELGRYGVTVNAIAPGGLTRMSKLLAIGGVQNLTDEQRAAMSPHLVAPICVWLASTRSKGITGRVFESTGAVLAVAEGWHRGPTHEPVLDPELIDPVARDLAARARPNADIHGADRPPG